ncbi:MAG TPA: sigma-54 dependent transcriptional regulator [Rhodocyclaceae bacterium]|nr:sigma-54 dependent transcriptional regulator [Rhodocyclaceae bacterium]
MNYRDPVLETEWALNNGAKNGETGQQWPVSVLVVDDEPGILNFLGRALSSRCDGVETAGSAEAAAKLASRKRYDVIILDITLPGMSGLDWLKDLRTQGFAGEVILMTAFADLQTAIDALRAGASDFILKPFRLPQMLAAVGRAVERSALLRENFILRRELKERESGVSGLIGRSPAIHQLGLLLKRLAPAPSTVLLLGESGTGKEIAARALHGLSGRSGPFVPVNCAAIAAELIESELFGHVRGAFTNAAGNRDGLFYYARGGTLFLDEVSELPLPMQAKLLRVLEERKIRPVGGEQEIDVDVRVVAATNRRLDQAVSDGRFRKDLYYRLHVVEISIPPLRERLVDLPDLVEHFNHQMALRLGLPAVPVSPEIIECLAHYGWPGNVRELKNLVERAILLGGFDQCLLPEMELPPAAPLPAGTDDDKLRLDLVERQHVLAVLALSGGNKSEAARRLGISRKTLDRRCAEWGVS